MDLYVQEMDGKYNIIIDTYIYARIENKMDMFLYLIFWDMSGQVVLMNSFSSFILLILFASLFLLSFLRFHQKYEM